MTRQPRYAETPEDSDYQQSRAAMRSLYGPRRIDGRATPATIQRGLKAGSNATSDSAWADIFKGNTGTATQRLAFGDRILNGDPNPARNLTVRPLTGQWYQQVDQMTNRSSNPAQFTTSSTALQSDDLRVGAGLRPTRTGITPYPWGAFNRSSPRVKFPSWAQWT